MVIAINERAKNPELFDEMEMENIGINSLQLLFDREFENLISVYDEAETLNREELTNRLRESFDSKL